MYRARGRRRYGANIYLSPWERQKKKFFKKKWKTNKYTWVFVEDDIKTEEFNNDSFDLFEHDTLINYLEPGRCLISVNGTSFPDFVSDVISDELFDEMVKGTNQNYKLKTGKTQDLLPDSTKGIMLIKQYFVCKLLRGIYNVKHFCDIFKLPIFQANPCYKYTKHFCRDSIIKLAKYFDMNTFDPSDNNPYKKFKKCFDEICEGFNNYYSKPFICSIDEVRVACCTSADPFQSYIMSKPIKKGKDIFTCG